MTRQTWHIKASIRQLWFINAHRHRLTCRYHVLRQNQRNYSTTADVIYLSVRHSWRQLTAANNRCERRAPLMAWRHGRGQPAGAAVAPTFRASKCGGEAHIRQVIRPLRPSNNADQHAERTTNWQTAANRLSSQSHTPFKRAYATRNLPSRARSVSLCRCLVPAVWQHYVITMSPAMQCHLQPASGTCHLPSVDFVFGHGVYCVFVHQHKNRYHT